MGLMSRHTLVMAMTDYLVPFPSLPLPMPSLLPHCPTNHLTLDWEKLSFQGELDAESAMMIHSDLWAASQFPVWLDWDLSKEEEKTQPRTLLQSSWRVLLIASLLLSGSAHQDCFILGFTASIIQGSAMDILERVRHWP